MKALLPGTMHIPIDTKFFGQFKKVLDLPNPFTGPWFKNSEHNMPAIIHDAKTTRARASTEGKGTSLRGRPQQY